jgi:amino acid transporter
MIRKSAHTKHFPIVSITISASRVTFAYSRDDALPFSRWLKSVNKHTKSPVNAVWFCQFIGALLGLLMFASPVAIGAVFSIGAIAQYMAFVTPIALKIFVAGDKFRPGESSLNYRVTPNSHSIPTNHNEGPWHLGRFSTPIGIVACSFVLLMIPILCFPATKGNNLNQLNMNYSCLIYGGSMFLALMWYTIDARTWFKGPKINVEHLLTVPQIEGQTKSNEGSNESVRNDKVN